MPLPALLQPLEVVQVGLGALVVLGVFVDALMTTLTVSAGAGPMTRRVLGHGWRGMLRLHRRDSESSYLVVGGTVLLITTVLTWVVLLWAGWALVFSGSGSVVESQTRASAGAADVVYYTGFTVFTLGTGDFVAASPAWRIVTAIASFTGLFLVTLAITYLISVVSAVVVRRSLALQIHALGRSGSEILARGWTGDRFSDMFEQQLVGLLPQVVVSAEQHLAYPVLHHFHARTSTLAAPQAIAHLDEALTLASRGVAEDSRPDLSAVEPLRFAVERYLWTATGTSWTPEADVPPPPSRDLLDRAGIPLVPEADFAEGVGRADNRRRELHRLVLSDGWSWQAE